MIVRHKSIQAAVRYVMDLTEWLHCVLLCDLPVYPLSQIQCSLKCPQGCSVMNLKVSQNLFLKIVSRINDYKERQFPICRLWQCVGLDRILSSPWPRHMFCSASILLDKLLLTHPLSEVMERAKYYNCSPLSPQSRTGLKATFTQCGSDHVPTWTFGFTVAVDRRTPLNREMSCSVGTLFIPRTPPKQLHSCELVFNNDGWKHSSRPD